MVPQRKYRSWRMVAQASGEILGGSALWQENMIASRHLKAHRMLKKPLGACDCIFVN